MSGAAAEEEIVEFARVRHTDQLVPKPMFVWPAQRSDTNGLQEQNYAREAVAAWQCEDVSRVCWYSAVQRIKT